MFSIIVPSFNSRIIDRTIASLKKQTFTDWECIIVDDNSTDDTLNRVRKEIDGFNNFVLIERDRLPKGAQTCRNIGASLAKGDFLVFLDSDDELIETSLYTRNIEIIKNNIVDFHVFPHSVSENNFINESFIPIVDSYLEEYLKGHFLWHTMSVVWKKDSFFKTNGFLEGLPRLNDPEIMIRSMQLGLTFKVYNEYKADSIYYPAQHDLLQFSHKMVDTFKIFLPSISKELNFEHRNYLKNYLNNWFNNIYFPLGSSNPINSLKVLYYFNKNKIINSFTFFQLVFFLIIYLFSSMLNKLVKNQITKVISK